MIIIICLLACNGIWYPESEYSRQRADAALKLGWREERGKERIL